jgi:hypothetical protein
MKEERNSQYLAPIKTLAIAALKSAECSKVSNCDVNASAFAENSHMPDICGSLYITDHPHRVEHAPCTSDDPESTGKIVGESKTDIGRQIGVKDCAPDETERSDEAEHSGRNRQLDRSWVRWADV